MTGLFFLMPSKAYGGWLSVAGRTPAPLDQAGVLDYADTSLGANRAAVAGPWRRTTTSSTASSATASTCACCSGPAGRRSPASGIEPAPDGDGFDVVVGYADG